MNQKLKELDQQVIIDVANHLNIPAYVVEKDVHVCCILNAISKIQNKLFDIILHGGTCLAKAYQVIQRMSEDCDFRLVPKNETINLSRTQRRAKIGLVKAEIISELKRCGYEVISDNSYNESTVNELQITYQSIFPVKAVLRKEIKLEFIVIPPMSECYSKPVKSLVKTVLQDKIDVIDANISCLSISEIAANKWVAFTRRIALSERGYKPFDPTVIRHLYDLVKLNLHKVFNNNVIRLINKIIKIEVIQYGKQHQEFVQNPLPEISYALEKLRDNTRWLYEWNRFIEIMVYDLEKMPFEIALRNFNDLSGAVLAALNKLAHFPADFFSDGRNDLPPQERDLFNHFSMV